MSNYASLRNQIHSILFNHPNGLTAWEIGKIMGTNRDGVHPRIVELVNKNLVYETGGKRLEQSTGKRCRVYVLAKYYENWAKNHEIDENGNIHVKPRTKRESAYKRQLADTINKK